MPAGNQQKHQAPVVQKVDSAIRWINLYPVDSAIGFPSTYPLDSDLSSGYSAIQRLNNRGLEFPFSIQTLPFNSKASILAHKHIF